MGSGLRTRLSAMMFLYYFSLGAWAITASTYLMRPVQEGGLQFNTIQVGWIYSTFAIGGMLATPLVGLLVDRLFRAEVVFSVANLIAGVMLFYAGRHCDESWQFLRTIDPATTDLAQHIEVQFRELFVIMLVTSFSLQIGLTLTTVLCLRNLPDPAHQFSRVRMYGTVGWVICCNIMGFFIVPLSSQPFYLAAGSSLVLAAYGLSLPKTYPLHSGRTLGESFGLPALQLFRKRSFLIFILAGIGLSQMNQFYGVYAHRYLTEQGISQAERWMTIGQVVEVLCMFIIPILRPRSTMKWLMVLGLFGGVVRYGALCLGWDWLILSLGVSMHGWSFALYFVVAATFLDEVSPPHLRASTQAIAAFMSSGFGPLTGNIIASRVVNYYDVNQTIDWQSVWLVPTLGTLAACAIFIIGFRRRGQELPQGSSMKKD